MKNEIPYDLLLEQTKEILKTEDDALKKVTILLNKKISYYNWVGFYFMNNNRQILEIGPYTGLKTDHTEIPFGKGICGQVAQSGETFVVEDVHAQDNYLACSIETKAEIVVPIYTEGKLIGQIDIDSHELDPFSEEDRKFLENLCELIGNNPDSYASHLPE